MKIDIHNCDCLTFLTTMAAAQVDLVYLDPPFFSQRQHRLTSKDRTTEYSFTDKWHSAAEYADFMSMRLRELHRVLKPIGSLFFHCDKTASHIARFMLDDIFGAAHFQAEIIWHYKRWSNSVKGLLPAHQTILFYSKSSNFNFNTILTDYSPTTNVDQILQKRCRDQTNKSVYARDQNGHVVYAGVKKGVPLSDVWTIPFLNPKAKERTGYPTQKPILLLERIIKLVTVPGDLILDPFCGSGTSLVAAKLLGRQAIGIDISAEACALTKRRIDAPIRTASQLLKDGEDAYRNPNRDALNLLNGIPHIPVQRNNGIDAFLQVSCAGVPIPVRIQKHGESIMDAAMALHKAGSGKNAQHMILIATTDSPTLFQTITLPTPIILVDSASLTIRRLINKITQVKSPIGYCKTCYNSLIKFEWDKNKAVKNFAKHRVLFSEAETVFDYPLYVDFYDPRHSDEEDRYLLVGESNRGRLLIVSYAERRDAICIISAREVTRTEREAYEES